MTASKGINKLPNELLIKILGHVPFTVENFYALSDVNDEFRDVVACPATLLKIVRRQYPELALLNNLRRVTYVELLGLKSKDARIKIAVSLISDEDDHPTTREALTLGVHLLDYLSTLTDDEGRDIVYVWAGLRASLKPRTIQALRFTIGRIYDYFFTTDNLFTTDMNFAEFLFNPIGGTPLGEMQMQRVEGSPLSTLKRRSFETALLMKKHNQHLSDMICQNTKGILQPEAARHYLALVESTRYSRLGSEDGEYEETLRYLQGMQWRMLKPTILEGNELEEENAEIEQEYLAFMRTPHEANVAIMGPFISELKEDMAAQKHFELGQAVDEQGFDVDLKAFGEVARTTLNQVGTDSLPRQVHNAVAKLRLLEGVPGEV